MLPRQVHRDHVSQRINVQPIFYRAVPKCRCNGNRELLKQRIQNGEARYDLRFRDITSVHFTHGGFVDRLAQINLQNFGMPRMLPLSACPAGRKAEAARANESFLAPRSLNFSGDGSRPAEMID